MVSAVYAAVVGFVAAKYKERGGRHKEGGGTGGEYRIHQIDMKKNLFKEFSIIYYQLIFL